MAVASLGCGIPAVAAGPAVGVAVGAAAAPAAAADDAPLSLTIDTLTPSSIPKSGKVTVSGSVTNNSDEVWTAVNVHAFIAPDPILTSSDLAFESTRGAEEAVGAPASVRLPP